MMVAQAPFETDMNQFCKLIPVVYADGTRAEPLDYPNDGEIWWMLTAHTSRLTASSTLRQFAQGTINFLLRQFS
jgi:hypothetical protein